jgi:sulfatase maturation enzyme AslB (radical SAM superfamily)
MTYSRDDLEVDSALKVSHDALLYGLKSKFGMSKAWKLRCGPSGIHFFNRVTGQNILFDEVSIPSHLWSDAPRQVSIALTNTCDLSCSYCYAPKTRAELSFDLLTSWLKEIDEQGCLGVGFGGGEPTYYARLAELCRFATEHTGLAVTLTTHGHNCTKALVQELTDCVNFVRVSMDGVDKTYEQLRGRPFEVLKSRLEIISTYIPFGINYVVNSQTLPELDKAIEVASDLGAREFLLLPEQPTATTSGIDAATLSSLQHWVYHYSGAIPLSISETTVEGFPVCSPLPLEMGLRAYAHIDAHGTLKATSYDKIGESINDLGLISAIHALRIQVQR